MEVIRVISESLVHARSHVNNGDSPQLIDLNPWDLQYLALEYAQKGMLYHKPSSSSSFEHEETVIQHLKESLSAVLDIYPILAGRLAIIPDDNDDTSSVFFTCNNAGVSFVHMVDDYPGVLHLIRSRFLKDGRKQQPLHSMEGILVISESIVQAQRHANNGDSPRLIDLNPWDIQYLFMEYAEKGMLYKKPSSSSTFEHKDTVIQHLKNSLSSVLDFYPPLAGRLAIIPNDDDDTSSIFITCNNAGASFVHAVAENITVADIVEPTYVPQLLYSFFPTGIFKNFEGTRVPLLAIQVTELADGIFIASSTNHCLAEVKPGWDFWNTWAEISRNGLNHIGLDSKLATFERWFPHGISIRRPIRIPFKEMMENSSKAAANSVQLPPFCRRIFHFKREKIAELKAKANSEVEDGAFRNKISSLQATLGHVWRSIIRNQNLDPEDEVTYRILISAKSRVTNPPIADDYFGITVQFTHVTMKVCNLLGDGGLGKFASELNKAISSCTEDKIVRDFEAWVQNPTMRSQRAPIGKFLSTSSSPRTNFYEIDFGWGRPAAVRLGPANLRNWKLAADAGAEEGSFDFELYASYEILEAMAKDVEFMHMVWSPPTMG